MKKLRYTMPAIVLAAAIASAPQPAFAMPTCEQEVSIRCQGYNVQGRPRLDIYHNSYEECVAAEQPMRCGIQPEPYASLTQRLVVAVLREAALSG
ncbi:hypothetical protein [Sphingomonas sp. GB1N7]|uniref:hypothetical protein n=1 Tax=Parasphingomonas caseinilytica TaxID=3096158 RepID=UPI002FCA6C09